VVHGPIPEGYDLSLHPVAFAGWIGMLVTMLNLLPAGQLDGGHIAYAVFGRRADLISKGVFLALLLMAPLTWPGWYIWAFMLLFVIRLRHPPIWDPDPGPLDRKRLLVAILSLVIFILTFMPNPISVR
jgi:membrane-associated protease RseP (regulator of RpoE activity)